MSNVFDAIGILQPLVINLKILFQKVCEEKFDWDEVISEELQKEWKIMTNSFKLTGKLAKSHEKLFLLMTYSVRKIRITWIR